MLLSLHQLRRYVDVPADPEAVATALTGLGFEVDEVRDQSLGLENVVAARILVSKPLPGSDHLMVCQVSDGGEVLPVVCGAPNAKPSRIAAWAKPGSALPGLGPIGKAVMRGQESHGMLCSENELGLGPDASGLLLLDEGAPVGAPLRELEGVCDVLLDVSVTPNRPDALSHIGLGRELAAHFGTPLRTPQARRTFSIQGGGHKEYSPRVEDPDKCSLYTGRILRGVRVAPSPDWLVRALARLGHKSINNVVDLTNFALLEWGQPSHAFDLDKLRGGVRVRSAEAGERLFTLDEQEIELDPNDLVIADDSGPVCLAGVIGGDSTKVDEGTRNVFLEVACFDPVTIRRQSRRHGITTDSSFRFERQVDPLNIHCFGDYLACLLEDVTGGSVEGPTMEARSPRHPRRRRRVTLRTSRVRRVLGCAIPSAEIGELLQGIEVERPSPDAGSDQKTYLVPGFRPDLEREIDLIEEVARLYDYNRIPEDLPRFSPQHHPLPPAEGLRNRIRRHLTAVGLWECLHLRFADPRAWEGLLLPDSSLFRQAVELKNPLRGDWSVLPTMLLPRLLGTLKLNQGHHEHEGRFFECGKVFFNRPDTRDARNPGVEEVESLGILLSGPWDAAPWRGGGGKCDYFTLKGLIENLLNALGFEFAFDFECPHPFLHPRESASLTLDGAPAGWLGALHPLVCPAFEVTGPCYAAEIRLDRLAGSNPSPPRFHFFARHAPVVREINAVVPEETMVQELIDQLPTGEAEFLEDVQLDNLYRGPEIGEGKKALHFRFTYRAPDRSLTDAEVNAIQTKLAARLGQDPRVSFK